MGKRKRRSKASTEAGASSSKQSKKSKRTTSSMAKDKRKNWSADLDKRFKIMKGAVEDVIEKKMTIRKAAEKWGVKRSTLADRVTGRVELGRRSGPPSILTRAEEQMLAEWIISMAQRGFGFKKHKLLKTVKKILDKDRRTTMLKKNMPGNKWYRQFVKRNPRVKAVTSGAHLGMGQLDKEAKPSMEYEALNSMLSACESESGSECDSDSDSELDSESGSEAEVESQPQSPIPCSIQAFKSELEPDQETENLDSEPDPLTPEDFQVDQSSNPDMAIGNTVTISTSE